MSDFESDLVLCTNVASQYVCITELLQRLSESIVVFKLSNSWLTLRGIRRRVSVRLVEATIIRMLIVPSYSVFSTCGDTKLYHITQKRTSV